MEKNIQSLILELINDESYNNVAFNYDSKKSIGHFEGDKNNYKYTIDISLTNNKEEKEDNTKKEESTDVDSSSNKSSQLSKSIINNNYNNDIVLDAIQGYSNKQLMKKYDYKETTIKTYISRSKYNITKNFCITPDIYNNLNVLARIQYVHDLRRLGFDKSSIVSITNDIGGSITAYSILCNCDSGMLVHMINDIINNDSNTDEIIEKYNVNKSISKYAHIVANKIKHKKY
jgi:hypothetical protein